MNAHLLLRIALVLCLASSTIGWTGDSMTIPQKTWYFGDVGKQGHSFRILVHHPDDYNKAVFINPRGENTTVVLNDLVDARQYATGEHPKNKFAAPIEKIGTLEDILPIVVTNLPNDSFSEKIIKQFGEELAIVGPDKSLHFTTNVGMILFGDPNQPTNVTDTFETDFLAITKALEISIQKELKDKGISETDPRVYRLANCLGTISANYIMMAKTMNELGLDRGDIYADLIGQYIGMALVMVKQLQFEQP